MSFGNMTLELNVFNMCKQPHEEEDDNEEANLIEAIVDDYLKKGHSSDPLETCLLNSFESSMQLDHDISNICSLLDCAQVNESRGWRPKFKD